MFLAEVMELIIGTKRHLVGLRCCITAPISFGARRFVGPMKGQAFIVTVVWFLGAFKIILTLKIILEGF